MSLSPCRVSLLSLFVSFAVFSLPSAHGSTPTELTALVGVANSSFGQSVAVSGSTVVIGAPGDDQTPGEAYVFTYTESGWAQAAVLTPSDCAEQDFFGQSVAIFGNTIVVGAPEHNVGSNLQQGAAYVFVEPLAGWGNMTETAELTSDDGQAYDRLGWSVAMNDATVVATAPDASVETGAAYVFAKPATGWATTSQYTAKLTASDGAAYAVFGWSASLNGKTLVVGAYDANGGHGSAYVFLQPSGGWSNGTQTAELTASDGASYDFFGWSVAVSDKTIGVGANQFDLPAPGKAYVFQQPANGWADMTQTAELTPSDGVAFEDFGASISLFGPVVAVGATHGSSCCGAAYVFLEPSGGWRNGSQTEKVVASNGSSNNLFGESVSIEGKVMLVGAPGESVGSIYAGAAYAY